METKIFIHRAYGTGERRFFEVLSDKMEIPYYKLEACIRRPTLHRVLRALDEFQTVFKIKIFSIHADISPKGHVCKVLRKCCLISIHKARYFDYIELTPFSEKRD